MVLLFLFAVLLAWPTWGLSIIAYIAFAMFRSYVNAHSRINYGRQRQAERDISGDVRFVPSWAGDDEENMIFITVIQKFAVAKGVPASFLRAVLGATETFKTLIYLAGSMERQGASFIEQQLAVSDKLIKMWENAPRHVRAAAQSV